MVDTLIRSKLHIPATRPELVARPRLIGRLAEGMGAPFTLISAPAGFGKTTLVAAAAAALGRPVAWLSLEPGDNQDGRFLRYLVAALQSADASIGREAADLLAAPQPAPAESLLTGLLNDLDAAGTDLVLVLDDYHSITNQAVHSAVTFLLEHRSATLHLVMTTRSDPPLPIARLRARGQIVELRAADLRFTVEEATEFLNAVMGLSLPIEQVTTLSDRTEGWIAGLQMAALSMRDRSDVAGFIAGFSGTHRFVLDYLLEEVLAGQPQDVQDFLLGTSILDRMCAPICDAVLSAWEPEQSGLQRIADSAGVLEYLERRNLFLVPLDDDRTWYRYHHLFADLLRVRLEHAHPGVAKRLHARAAAWFEAQGMAVEAINHALAGGAGEQAARLVEENTTGLLARGELAALMGWIAALPAELRQSRPWLCMHQAYPLAFAGRTAEAEPLLAQAEVALAGRSNAGEEDARALAGAIAALRAMLTVMGGRDDAGAVALAARAQELLAPERAWDRATAAWARGYAERTLGHLDAAETAFEEQIALARRIGNVWTLVTGLMDLAMVLRSRGQLVQARARLEEALQEAGRQGARSLGYIARMEAGLAGVLYEQNELHEARRLLDDAVAHVRQWPNPNHLAYAFSLLARVQRAQGDTRGAAASIMEAEKVARTAALTRIVRRMVEADQVRLCYLWPEAERDRSVAGALAAGAAAIVKQWQDEMPAPVGRYGIGSNGASATDESGEAAALMLARIHLADDRPGPALAIVQAVSQGALAAGRIPLAIEAFGLSARAQADAAGQGMAGAGPRAALDALGHALELAEPGGFMRVFLNEGRPMQLLLAQWLAHAGGNRLRDFAAKLLAAFDGELAAAGRRETATLVSSLPEPLSPRELEVLHLLAQGLSNQEIAAQLIVAPGTVKAQTAAIYRKLDVANRTQAVARGRELGLIP